MTTIIEWKYPLTSLSCLFLFNIPFWLDELCSPRQKSFHAVMKTATISKNIFSVNKCQRFYLRKFHFLRKLSSRARTANVTADMWIFFPLLGANQHQHQCLLLAFISHNLNIFIVRSAMPSLPASDIFVSCMKYKCWLVNNNYWGLHKRMSISLMLSIFGDLIYERTFSFEELPLW